MSRTSFKIRLLGNERDFSFEDGNQQTDLGCAIIGDNPYEHEENTRYPHGVLATLRLKQNGEYNGNGKSLKELVKDADNRVLEIYGTLSKDLYWELRNNAGEVDQEETRSIPHASSADGATRSLNESELLPPEIGGQNNWAIQDSNGEIWIWTLRERLVIEVFSPLQINYLPRTNGNGTRRTTETPPTKGKFSATDTPSANGKKSAPPSTKKPPQKDVDAANEGDELADPPTSKSAKPKSAKPKSAKPKSAKEAETKDYETF